MTQKKVLVTGGAGFIGSHLCKKLLELNHHVIAIDNHITSNKNNLTPLLTNPNFKHIKHDVTIPLKIDHDEIYHLACPASPIHYQKDPIQTMKTSLLGSINILELAKQTTTPILQASTSEIYGDPQEHPQKENYWGNVNPIGIRACYNEGKRCAETLFFDYHRHYKTNIKVARIFNTYGPNMALNDGRVVSNFIIQALQNKPITIYGDGTQTRSFCFIDDLILALISFMNTPKSITGPINIGNPHEITIIELAHLIIHLTHSSSTIINKPLPDNDPKKRLPDITLAKQQLNWEPSIHLKEGLIKTIAYFQNII